MKTYLYVFMLAFSLILVGCSSDDDKNINSNKANDTSTISLEDQILRELNDNSENDEHVIDYDIKGDYIFVISTHKLHGLKISILKKEGNEVNWVIGERDVTSLTAEGAPVATVLTEVQLGLENAKDIRVFGEPVKSVEYQLEITDDYSKNIKYWVVYTDKLLDFSKDVEYITD